MQSIIEVSQLKVYYDTALGQVKAVDDVDLLVKRGEIMGIAGESGCGKSTLAKSILGLHGSNVYMRGKILFEGKNLLSLKEEELRMIRGRYIGYIPQNSMSSLNPTMRIKDQIIDAMKEHGLIKKESKDVLSKISEIFERVGLQERCITAYPHELSGGMRQRALIACILSLQPSVIIADEPTTAMDVVTQRGIIDLLKDLNEKMRITLIVITHDMGVHAMLCDRVAIMYAGKVVEIARVEKCFKEPLHPYTKMLISSIPKIGKKEKLQVLPGNPPDLRNPPEGCRFHPRCPFAKEKCKKEEPKLKFEGTEEYVACHLYW